jgi:hypothetical protein
MEFPLDRSVPKFVRVLGKYNLFPTLTVCLILTSCTALVQRSVPPERVLREELPGWAVIGTTEGEEIVLRTPRVQGDSLVVGSVVERVGDYADPPDLIGIPIDEIVWVGTLERDRVGEAKALANATAIVGFLIVPWVVALTIGVQ